MGKMIDADGAKEILYVSKERITNNLSNQITSFIRENYIPKTDYENRLKAEKVAMLEDLDLQIDELAAYNLEVAKVQRLIRDRIDKLKENKKWK